MNKAIDLVVSLREAFTPFLKCTQVNKSCTNNHKKEVNP